MHPLITSHHNTKIKNVILLEKARERKHQNAFVVEGLKELSLAMMGGYQINSVFFCPEIIDAVKAMEIVGDENLLIPVSRTVYEKIAYRDSTEGILAIGTQKNHPLQDLVLRNSPLLLILESVEKPGNLGAILRTADAAKLDGVIICDPQTDFYNPNVIRSSVGCMFTTPIASATSEEAILWLRMNNITCLATHLAASKPYFEIDFGRSTAIVMGTESTGLSEAWVAAADTSIIIPMQGKVDSLNVSTAAAIIVFEAIRQRGLANG